jgi:hypothetical protein
MGLPNKKPPIRISLPKLTSDQEATVINLRQETDALASWPTGERLRALQRIIPRVQVEAVLTQAGHDRVDTVFSVKQKVHNRLGKVCGF